ncbi:MAG: NADP-dependent oxidoreductase [Dehalococcoidia bacterium]
MSTEINVRVLLKSRPNGFPTEDDFDVVESPIPQPQQGEILMESLWLSLDPYMRGRMNEAKSYAPSVNVGESMVGGAVARVVESRSPLFSPGDIVEGRFGWQSYAISNGIGVRKVDESLAPVQTAVGVLGMPGLTAYFGFLDVCDPKPGDTVVVSAASGAVGQIVGQIAKIMGCKVVGTAGSEAKVKFIVDELGFDYAINYKTTDVAQSLDELCPEGIDVYFDNVGGLVTDAVMDRINTGARIAICGQISQYNLKTPDMAPRSLGLLTRSQAKMEGFLVFAYESRYEEGITRMASWIKEGKLKYKEDVVVGLKNAPRAFIGMLNGENFGKTLIKISE